MRTVTNSLRRPSHRPSWPPGAAARSTTASSSRSASRAGACPRSPSAADARVLRELASGSVPADWQPLDPRRRRRGDLPVAARPGQRARPSQAAVRLRLRLGGLQAGPPASLGLLHAAHPVGRPAGGPLRQQARPGERHARHQWPVAGGRGAGATATPSSRPSVAAWSGFRRSSTPTASTPAGAAGRQRQRLHARTRRLSRSARAHAFGAGAPVVSRGRARCGRRPRRSSSIRPARVSGRCASATQASVHLAGRGGERGEVGGGRRPALEGRGEVRRDLQPLRTVKDLPAAVGLRPVDRGQARRRHPTVARSAARRAPCWLLPRRCAALRGAKYSLPRSSSKRPPVLSTQPKHRASSTAAS